jgi:hypothetical protein
MYRTADLDAKNTTTCDACMFGRIKHPHTQADADALTKGRQAGRSLALLSVLFKIQTLMPVQAGNGPASAEAFDHSPGTSGVLRRAFRMHAGGKGAPLPGWSDTGGDSWEGDQTEAYTMFFAFAAIIENDITVRSQPAAVLHACGCYVLTKSVLGVC